MDIIGSEEYLKKIHEARSLNLFLDYDGTLADFTSTPDEVNPDPQLIDLIEQLEINSRIKVIVISGRQLVQIKKLIPVSGVIKAGTYGVEILFPDGNLVVRAQIQKIRPVLETIKPKWQKLINHNSGFFLDDKHWSLAIHAKNVEDIEAEKVLSKAKKVLTEIYGIRSGFRILGGNKYLEIAPINANKGATVDFLLRQLNSHALSVYLGDDDKDEEAYKIILENQGVAVKVGGYKCETSAQLRIINPQSVRVFLSTLL